MTRRSYKGKNNPFFGKKHLEQSKQKIRDSEYHKNLKGKNNSNYDNHSLKGYKHSPEACKKISENKKISQFGKNNPFYGKKHKTDIKCNHHIYLRPNPRVICITFDKHRQLHARAYDYLVETYGHKSIDNYIKWFTNKYGLKIYGPKCQAQISWKAKRS